jgi:hypothetical protein
LVGGIVEADNGDIVLVGRGYLPPEGGYDLPWAARVGADDAVIWQTTFPDAREGGAFGVARRADGGVLLVGSSGHDPGYHVVYRAWLVGPG